jgi:uncharacterized protein (TIGR00369 family)
MTDVAPDLRTGLDQLLAIFGPERPEDEYRGIGSLIGMRADEVAAGRVVFSLETGPALANPLGIVHGGVAATLLDSAMGCAVHSLMQPGEGYTTLDLNVHYTRGIALDLGRISAIGEVVHRGRRMATAEGRVVDEGGRLLAHGTTTCMVFPPAGAGA